MRKLLFATIAIGFLFLTQACDQKKKIAPEESCHFQQNSYLQRVSWLKRPVTMYSDSTLTADQVASFEKAMEIWNEEFRTNFGGKDIFVFGGVLPGRIGVLDDKRNVISLVGDWIGAREDQAQTRLSWASNYVVDADISLNGSKNFASSDDVRADQLDTVALLVHELGHVLGLLDINEDSYSIMRGSLAQGDTHRREIGPLEVDALRCEY